MKRLHILSLSSVARIALLMLALGLVSCERLESQSLQASDTIADRWYSQQHVERGQLVFLNHCSSCHGEFAQGLAADWKTKLPDGSFPPPPLNGSAHAWHHPLSVLLNVINDGGIALGGKMPGFQSILTEQEKLAVVAFFQNYWSDDIYANWIKMGGSN
jgi:mono/diheme cytochrome c family protein